MKPGGGTKVTTAKTVASKVSDTCNDVFRHFSFMIIIAK